MLRNLSILLALVVIVALPFAFRQRPPAGAWRDGDPVVRIVSPHNEAIRYEFGRAFSAWHQKHHGRPVKIEWLNIGGTTEISRYLAGEYATSAKAWWTGQPNRAWQAGMTDALTKSAKPDDAAQATVWQAYRGVDDSDAVTCKIDLFFGGGEFDHSGAFRSGFTVAPWPTPEAVPPGLFRSGDVDLIPERLAGETWRTPTVFGNVVSTFGIVYNVDRLRDLKVDVPPKTWDDLADPRYYKHVGLADPTKSGSIAKAFENIVHAKMRDAARAAGHDDAAIAANERRIDAYIKERGKDYQRGQTPDDLTAYQQTLERGWADGLFLIQAIAGNARYFTDSASKVPIDVAIGDCAVGMSIDFYGRFQAENSAAVDGRERMVYVAPVGGTSVSCDPISLLRGAPAKEVATRFIEFTLSEDGQRLWTYKPGEPGGPTKYALRRLPIRRDFYPSTNPSMQARHEEHKRYASDALADPAVDPYTLAQGFTYYSRWTGRHFGIMRDIVRAMCLDSGEELREGWPRIAADPVKRESIRRLPTMSVPPKGGGEPWTLSWRNAPDFAAAYDPLAYTREWTAFYRELYDEARD